MKIKIPMLTSAINKVEKLPMTKMINLKKQIVIKIKTSKRKQLNQINQVNLENQVNQENQVNPINLTNLRINNK